MGFGLSGFRVWWLGVVFGAGRDILSDIAHTLFSRKIVVQVVPPPPSGAMYACRPTWFGQFDLGKIVGDLLFRASCAQLDAPRPTSNKCTLI